VLNKLVNLKYVIIFILLLSIAIGIPSGWKIHKQHQIIVDLRNKNIAQWEKWKNDSTKVVVLAKENKELNNLYASQIKATTKWKNLAANINVVEVILNEEFSIDTLTDCYYAEAIMNIKSRKGKFDIIPQPVTLYEEVAYIDKGLSVGRMWSEPECLIFDKNNVKLIIPEGLNLDCYKENKWPWVVGALGVGIIIGLIVE